jgi:hypothetical protein
LAIKSSTFQIRLKLIDHYPVCLKKLAHFYGCDIQNFFPSSEIDEFVKRSLTSIVVVADFVLTGLKKVLQATALVAPPGCWIMGYLASFYYSS